MRGFTVKRPVRLRENKGKSSIGGNDEDFTASQDAKF
jgi:hypothetical protein